MSKPKGPNKAALRQLRRVVKAVPDDLLHMHSITSAALCGTAHCAIGWAAIDPWFIKKFETSIHYEWAAPFNLSEKQADILFAGDACSGLPDHAITKAEVLANIDRILAGKRALVYKALRS